MYVHSTGKSYRVLLVAKSGQQRQTITSRSGASFLFLGSLTVALTHLRGSQVTPPSLFISMKWSFQMGLGHRLSSTRL